MCSGQHDEFGEPFCTKEGQFALGQNVGALKNKLLPRIIVRMTQKKTRRPHYITFSAAVMDAEDEIMF